MTLYVAVQRNGNWALKDAIFGAARRTGSLVETGYWARLQGVGQVMNLAGDMKTPHLGLGHYLNEVSA